VTESFLHAVQEGEQMLRIGSKVGEERVEDGELLLGLRWVVRHNTVDGAEPGSGTPRRCGRAP
jgi:hypothetical protein